MSKALFLDRDGVINVDKGYVHVKEDFVFIEGIFDVLAYAVEHEYLLIIITNQSGIGRGLFSLEQFIEVTEWMLEKLTERNIYITHLYYSPLLPNQKTIHGRFARKPDPGMILAAQKDYNIELSSSVLLGDRYSDVIAGINAGIKTNILYSKKFHIDKRFYVIKELKDTIQFL